MIEEHLGKFAVICLQELIHETVFPGKDFQVISGFQCPFQLSVAYHTTKWAHLAIEMNASISLSGSWTKPRISEKRRALEDCVFVLWICYPLSSRKIIFCYIFRNWRSRVKGQDDNIHSRHYSSHLSSREEFLCVFCDDRCPPLKPAKDSVGEGVLSYHIFYPGV